MAHRILHANLWRDFGFHDIASWKAAITQSIPEREYSFVESHANSFAGLVLVPAVELARQFDECTTMAEQQGLDIHDEATGAIEYVEAYISRIFEVSGAVIHRRLEADGLLKGR